MNKDMNKCKCGNTAKLGEQKCGKCQDKEFYAEQKHQELIDLIDERIRLWNEKCRQSNR